MSWEVVKLGDVCDIIAGQSPESKYYNKDGKGKPFFQGKADFKDDYPSVRYYTTKITKTARINDILLSVRAPVGPTNICNIEACIGRGLAAIRTRENTFYKYIYYHFKSIEKNLSATGNGSTFSAITTSDVKNIPVPLPPLPIQKQIADILDNADALRKKDLQLLQHYDALAQSLFIDMFGDPVKNEKGWELNSVVKYCDCIVPGRDKPKSFTGNVPWVTTADLIHMGFTANSKKGIGLTKLEIKEAKAKIIPKNSIIITCVGDLGIITLNLDEIVINQQLHAFQCKKDINPIFLMYSLNYQKSYMYKMASSTTVPYMNKTVCNSIPTIYPPIALQNQFATLIQNIELQKVKVKAQIQASENLFQALLQKAFNQEL